MNRKLFSILIVNYNHGSYIEQAILSVLNQSCNDFELIIIDGKSTDNSVEIIKKYESHISYWISEPDRGQSDAFNKGFEKAKGIFGFWLNADDILLPDSLLSIKKIIEIKNDSEWFIADTIFIDKNNKILKCRRGSSWCNLLSKNSPIEVYGPSSIFSLRLLKEVGGFDESMYYSMDTDLWIRFVKAGYKFVHISHYVWGFRKHDDSKSAEESHEKGRTKYIVEGGRILEKNNWKYLKYKILFRRIYKMMNGTYLRSYIDSKNMKSKIIRVEQ